MALGSMKTEKPKNFVPFSENPYQSVTKFFKSFAAFALKRNQP